MVTKNKRFSVDNQPTKRRGPKRYFFMVNDVARVRGCAVQTVRNHVAAGKVDLSDLRSVVEYCK